MKNYFAEGTDLRMQIKELIYDFMVNSIKCSPNAEGLSQAEIFRACGLDWGDQTNAASTKQQYWAIAILRVLENDGKIVRLDTKKWRLK